MPKKPPPGLIAQNKKARRDYHIEETFEAVEVALESLPDDVDIRGAEGVIIVTFSNGVVFV